MEKTKSRDLKFWLDEKELKTPKHDEMVLWTFNNAEKILRELENNSIKSFFEYRKDINIIKTIEYPILGKNNFNLGFIDLFVKLCFNTNNFYMVDKQCGFEIKPQVKSIGEVLRQFQFYKSNLPEETILILVTSTKGLKEIFESQGFYVIEYKEEGNGNV